MGKRGFVIHWNGPAAKCVGQSHDRCERFWLAVKSYHVNTKGWSDIAYSFGVCPHGVRFTGRGWFKNQFANGRDVVGPNDGADSEWYTVLVFLGEGEKPTEAMTKGVKALIHEGRTADHCGDRVLPHNAFKVKTCPGPEFTAFAKLWDNQPLFPAKPAPAPKPAPATDTTPLETDVIYHIKDSPYSFLHMGGRDFLPLTEATFWDLAGQGVKVVHVSNDFFQSTAPVAKQGSLLHGKAYGTA